MRQIKYIFFTFLMITSLNALSDIEDLYIQAQKFEAGGNYKKAMQIYKDIASKQKKINRVYIDEDKQKELQSINETIDTIEDKETTATIQQIIASTFELYPYQENYLLPFSYDMHKRKGRKQTETKFQISIKKPIVHNFFGLDETINFGYTHTSFWQLYDSSSPFRETNYKPELFVNIPYGKKDKTSLKGFTLGVIHESNGEAEEKSRSWNRLYLESYFQLGNLFLIPKVWYRFHEDEESDDNPDLIDYMGYGDLTLVYPYKKHTFKVLLRNNLKRNDNKGFIEGNWTFPLFNSKNTFGFVQMSSGYGESLIDYDKEVNRISFGISLSR